MVAATYSHPAFKIGDGKDIDMNGQIIRNGSLNAGNLLAGIVPTFSGAWTTEPGTLAEIVSEQTAVQLTTPGVTTGSATMLWDLGSVMRVIGFTDHEFSNMIMWGSQDYVNWFQLTVTNVAAFGGLMRYINMTTQAHAAINFLKVIVYRI